MEESVSNIILGVGGHSDRFKLKYGVFTFNLKIKPISVARLIEISSELSHIRSIDETQKMFPSLMDSIDDIRYIAKAITIATGTRFRRIINRAILKLPLKDINILWSIVYRQSDPSPFFFIISMTGRMNILKKKQE